jgi:hypothetical protein
MGRHVFRLCLAFWAVGIALTAYRCWAGEPQKTQNVIFIMIDGVRWQEVFTGVDNAILQSRPNPQVGAQLDAVNRKFGGKTPEASRNALMPFFWNVVARQGQVFGNQAKKSRVLVTNDFKFSYPGYSETFCGFADPRINRNDVGPNPNVTVFEWLAKKSSFQNRVAAFGAWTAFNDILNRDRCGFLVNAGFDPLANQLCTPKVALLDRLKKEVPSPWREEPYDALTFYSAMEFFKAKHPPVLFVSLAETDEWGHDGRYDEYLTATHRFDAYVKMLWETAQSLPQYRGTTTLIVSADHGRGLGPVGWKNHDKSIPNSDGIWIGVLGPDTLPLGERSHIPDVKETQIAATLAALLGEDYNAAVPKAGPPIADVLPK